MPSQKPTDLACVSVQTTVATAAGAPVACAPAAAAEVEIVRIRPRRRRRRWALRVVVGLPLLCVLAALLLTRSPLVGRMVASQVEAQLGSEFHGTAYWLTPGGRLIIDHPRLTAPALAGEAAQFLRADRAVVDLDWSGAPFSGPTPKRIRLHGPAFRVSVATEDGSINLDGLGVTARAPGAATVAPPLIDLIDARLEFGEHSILSGHYQPLTSVPVAGHITPLGGDSIGAFAIKLEQTAPASGARAEGVIPSGPLMILEGQVDLESSDSHLSLHNVNLDEWPADVIPSGVRDIWRRLNIQGTVRLASFKYTQGAGVEAAVALDGVSMDALVPADRPEVAADKPLKLTGVSGTVKLSRMGLDAVLEGSLGDLPARVALRTTGATIDAPLRCEITTKRFRVSENPELMPFLPPIVRKRFASFSGPTAVVDARVLIERGEPIDGAMAPLSISGSLAFENGRAAFDKFPYPFQDLRGLVTFDDQKIEIVNIKGRGPTGAILFADGQIAPVSDDPQVRVDVLVLDLPIDDVLHQALPGDRRGIIDELFNQERYQELVNAGLVISTQGAAEAQKELEEALGRRFAAGSDLELAAELDERIRSLELALVAPRFDLGGTAQVAVRVRREAGLDQPFEHTTEVQLSSAGLVPRGFAYPFNASDVVLHIGEQEAVLHKGAFAGLTGGRAELEARIQLRDEQDRPRFQPHVRVSAQDIPVDRLLINAIPERKAETQEGQAEQSSAGLSPKELLSALNLAGTVDCTAVVTPDPEAADEKRQFSVDVLVGLNNLAAAPAGFAGGPALFLRGLSGTIHVDDDALTVRDLRGQLTVTRQDVYGAAQERSAGELALEAVAALKQAPEGSPSLTARVHASDLDLAAPLEQAIALVSPRGAEMLASLRKRHRAEGQIDLVVDLAQNGAGQPDLEILISGARDIGFDALEGRFGLDLRAGSATMRLGPEERLAFDNASAAVQFNGNPTLVLNLDGSMPLLGRDTDLRNPDEPGVTARLSGVRLESQLARSAYRALMRTTAPVAAAATGNGQPAATARPEPDLLERIDLRGLLDAELTIRPRAGTFSKRADVGEAGAITLGAGMGAATGAVGEAAPAGSRSSTLTSPSWSRYELVGSIWPRTLAVMHQGRTVDVPLIDGRIVLEPAGGRFDNLRAVAAADRWRIGVDGSWQNRREDWGTGTRVDTVLSVAGNDLDPSLLELLPRRFRETVEKARLRLEGPFAMEDARLAFWTNTKMSQSAEPGGPRRPDAAVGAGHLLFDGQLSFRDLSLNMGVPIDRSHGSVAVLVQQDAGAKSPTVDVTFRGDSMTVAGLPLTGARARIVSSSTPGQLLVPQIVADLFGGRVTASGVLGGLSSTSPKPGESGIRLSNGTTYQLTATIAGTRFAPLAAAGVSLDGKPRAGRPYDSRDESRGRVDASFSISGTLGQDHTRFGRGSIRIAGGEVLQLNGLERMLELSNLQLPSSEALDYVQAGFDIKGDRVTFDQIAVMSESVSIMGNGFMSLPDMGLNFRFNSQAATGRRIPLVSGLFEAVRNELITTVIGGTLSKPKIKTETLSTTRKALSGIFGGGNDDAAPKSDLKAGEKSARSERDRLKSRPPQSAPEARVLTLPPGHASLRSGSPSTDLR